LLLAGRVLAGEPVQLTRESLVRRTTAELLFQQGTPVDEYLGDAASLTWPGCHSEEVRLEQQQQFHEALLVSVVQKRGEYVRYERRILLPRLGFTCDAQRIPEVVQNLVHSLKKLWFELIGSANHGRRATELGGDASRLS
jgi:hypothetical protein